MESEVGNIVKLKSGGPKMTVTNVPNSDTDHFIGQTHIGTMWFAGAKRETAHFPAEALEKVEEGAG